jgi:pilus assembly protein Flp/PilA
MKGQLQKGQGMVEYAFILVLVAVIIIAALALLGPIVSNLYMSVVNKM